MLSTLLILAAVASALADGAPAAFQDPAQSLGAPGASPGGGGGGGWPDREPPYDGGGGGGAPQPPYADDDRSEYEKLAAGEPAEFLVTYKVSGDAVEAQAQQLRAAAAGGGAAPGAKAAGALLRRAGARGGGGGAPAGVDLMHGARVGAQDEVKGRVLSAQRPAGVRLLQDFEQLPVSKVQITGREALQQLLADPEVESVAPVLRMQLHDGAPRGPGRRLMMDESLPLIRQPEAVAKGYMGTGCTVAVIDTGVKFDTPELQCKWFNDPKDTCRVIDGRNFAKTDVFYNEANPNNGWSFDIHGHGTNVSGIVARTAPGVKIYACDVGDDRNSDNRTLLSIQSSWILDAFNNIITRRYELNICSINLSIGALMQTQESCLNDGTAQGINAARRVGILTAVSSGNDGFYDRMSVPACNPEAVSVGATIDHDSVNSTLRTCANPPGHRAADDVVCYSNSVRGLKLLAPGTLIKLANDKEGMHGTSFAAPHVAATIAVLRAAVPYATPDEILDALTVTGKRVTDWRNGLEFPRLDLAAAVEKLVADLRNSEPGMRGRFILHSNRRAVNGPNVRVEMWRTDVNASSGMTGACFSFDQNVCTEWRNYTGFGSMNLTIPREDQVHTVYAWMRNGNDTLASPMSAQIRFDSVPPVGTVEIAGRPKCVNTRDVIVSVTAYDVGSFSWCVENTKGDWECLWAPPNDPGSGYYQYAPPGSFSTSTPFRLGLSAQGNKTVYLHLYDEAYNYHENAANYTVLYDSLPPDASVRINDGAGTAIFPNVTLSLAAADAGTGVQAMCVSNTPGPCAPFEPFAASKAWVLAGNGSQTVYATFMDGCNNSASVSATVDVVGPGPPPAVELFKLNNGAPATMSADVELSIRAPNATKMCVSNTQQECTQFEVFQQQRSWKLASSDDGEHTVYLWLKSAAGVVTPSPAAASIKLDSKLVSAAAAGGGFTRTPALTLRLSAANPAEMCATDNPKVTTAAACKPWITYAPEPTVKLSRTGRRTVRVFFRGGGGGAPWGPATVDVNYDRTAPRMSKGAVRLSATRPNQDFKVTWLLAADDKGAGVEGYVLVASHNGAFPPASCGTEGGATVIPFTVSGNTAEAVMPVGQDGPDGIRMRLCAFDKAGNRAKGLTLNP
ncbi:MAG: hypothetical protein J3K34DRAFT_472987 [Monoraphidium minutum]|nr:MAG: hypothetical protein J3K34DRAFT_472987 [Monoraphidium minutum]